MHNVIWILIDSARNFQTDEDDRGLPQSVADFAREALYFRNVACSAPSTIMSVSSMMTSTPSYLLSRSYHNFPGITDDFDTLPWLLRDKGYKINGAIYFKHGREAMSNLFGHLEKKYLPGYLKHRKEVWTNTDIFNVFSNIVEKNDWSKPSFNYLHFNVRVDKNISSIIEQTIAKIQAAGLDKNSIIVINSDHGYPMPMRGWDRATAKDAGWGHDMLLYNDNILTPLVIKSPAVQPQIFEQMVSTIDITPTLCGLLKLPVSEKFFGRDLLEPTHQTNPKTIRVDNRYIGQVPSSTAIIDENIKLIVNTDADNASNYELYDLSTDPDERTSLDEEPASREMLNEMLVKYRRSEQNLTDFHKSFLKRKWRTLLKNQSTSGEVAVLLNSTVKFSEAVKDVFTDLLSDAHVHMMHTGQSQRQEHYDLVICVLDSEIPWHSKRMINDAKSLPTPKVIFTDNNGAELGSSPAFRLYRRYVGKRMQMFKHDKLYIFELIKRVVFRKMLGPIKD